MRVAQVRLHSGRHRCAGIYLFFGSGSCTGTVAAGNMLAREYTDVLSAVSMPQLIDHNRA